ncbi:MAG: diguanylate cyclase [Planctomycetota bacterium]|nr:diguanylate cyclase [Planctomycetota bacterium]
MSGEELSKLVFTDDLTGLYNRRWMFKYLGEHLQHPQADKPPALSLLMMDLDGFKSINDTRGHREGDRELVRFAETLKGCFGDRFLLVRYAGDEFSVLMPQTSKSEALAHSERLRRTVETGAPSEGAASSATRTTVSIGVATFPSDATDPELLIELADKALYFSKQSGKNRATDAAQIGGEVVFAQDLMRRFPCTHLVGRETELEHMNRVIESCREAHNRFVLVRGEPGIGKTRFLGEIVRLADMQQFICLFERCAKEEAGTAYRPLLNLLNRYLSSAPEELKRLFTRISDEHLLALKGALPVLEPIQPRRTQVAEPAPEKRRQLLFEALVKVLCFISERMPLAILFDEFQHVDSGTLEIVRQVLGMIRGRVLVCGAVAVTEENEKLLAQGPLAAFLDAVRPTEFFKTVALGPLDVAQVGQLISLVFQERPPAPEFDRKMHQLTKGNPLYVEEILKSLVAQGRVAREKGAWKFPPPGDLSAPESLKHAIGGRLESLDDETRRIISTAAVIGPNFDMDVLKTVEGVNESETLDIVDRAKKKGLIVRAKPLSDDKLAFASEHLRATTYEKTDDRKRTELHGKVGKAEEALLGAEGAEHADRLAYHFRLGGETEKTAQYEQLAREVSGRLFKEEETSKYHERLHRILRWLIRDADKPLDDAAMGAVGGFLRSLGTAIRNMRMYPSGSRLIQTAVEQTRNTLQTIMAASDVFTLAEEKAGLAVNNVTVGPKDLAGTASEMIELLKTHHLRSITFTKQCTQQELETIIMGLGMPTDKSTADPEHWNKFLDEHSISNIALNQKEYFVTEERVSDQTRRYKRSVETPLDQQAMLMMRDVLRYFSATVENIGMYPAGSQLIVGALDQLINSLADVFRQSKIITFSEVDGALLINGALANPQSLGNPVTNTLAVLRRHGVKSCSFADGVTRTELEVFLSALAGPASEETARVEFWDKLFKERSVEHIAVGHKLYAAVEGLKGPAPADGETKRETRRERIEAAPPSDVVATPPPVQHAAPAGEDELKQAQHKAPAELADLLSDEAQKTSRARVETLTLDGRTEEAAALVDRIAQAFAHGDPKTRLRCAGFFESSIDKAAPAARSLYIERILTRVVDALRVEPNQPAHAKLCSLAAQLVEDSFDRRALDRVARLVWALFRQREGDPSFGEEQKRMGMETLRRIAESAAANYLFVALGAQEPPVREGASNVIAGLGAAIAGRLARFVKETDDYGLGKFAATTLRQLAPEAAAELVKDLTPFIAADEGRRIAAVLEHLSPNVESDIAAALRHPDGSVRKEGINIVRRMDAAKATHVMMQALDDDDPNMIIAAVTFLGEQKVKDAALELVKLVEKTKDDRIRKEACLALGRIVDARTIGALCKVVDYRPGATRIFGLGGGYPEEVRAAAAWALGNFPAQDDVKSVLERAAQDRSASVRAAAKLSLRR